MQSHEKKEVQIKIMARKIKSEDVLTWVGWIIIALLILRFLGVI